MVKNSCLNKHNIMDKIIRKGGYVYLMEGDKGFETFYNLGKDENDPMWKEEVEKMNFNKKKKRNKPKN